MAKEKFIAMIVQGLIQWNDYVNNAKKQDYRSNPVPDLSDWDAGTLRHFDFHRFLKYDSTDDWDAPDLFKNYNDGKFTFQQIVKGWYALDHFDFGWCNLQRIDFNHISLRKADFENANIMSGNLKGANLTGANLSNARLQSVDLTGANLTNANLTGANLTDAILDSAILNGTNFSKADLTNASMLHANLEGAILVDTNLEGANISDSRVYGISSWNLNLKNCTQKNLIITKRDEPVITVTDLAVAQFIYMMLNNKNIRNVINSITSKGVLILGRFSDPKRKEVLDKLREKLILFDLLPIVFDFDCPTDKDYTETVQTIAGMSMFVIADVTNPKSTPLELEATVKQFKIPYVPIIDISVDSNPFAMMGDLQKSFHWVLPTLKYDSIEKLLNDNNLKKYILEPVNRKREELRIAKNAEPESIILP